MISIELGKPRRALGFLGDSWNQGPKVKLSPALARETPFLFEGQWEETSLNMPLTKTETLPLRKSLRQVDSKKTKTARLVI